MVRILWLVWSSGQRGLVLSNVGKKLLSGHSAQERPDNRRRGTEEPEGAARWGIIAAGEYKQ